MKRLNIISLLTGCLLLASCAEEDFRSDTNPKVIEGMPVTATLSFQSSDLTQVTKATDEESKRVNDLYVLVFNSDGKLSTAQYFGNDTLSKSAGKVKVTMLSGTNYIYAAANVTGNNFSATGNTLKSKIDEFTKLTNNTLDAWKSFSASMVTNDYTWSGGNYLMAGFFTASAPDGDALTGDGAYTISPDGQALTLGAIQLVRVLSEFTFNITSAGNGTFTPTSWELRNAPQSVYLYKQADETSKDNGFFDVSGMGVTANKFQFTLLENLQGSNNPYDESYDDESYEEADWRENPENAPTKGTFIVLKGHYVGQAQNPFKEDELGNRPMDNVDADVTYFIHLGYITNVDDYSVRRNHKYTYNIKITGIDKIVVEAYDKDPETHRADGVIRFADAKVIQTDAHYGVTTLYFPAGTMVDEFISGIQTVKTGFQYQDISTLKADNQDTDWVLFMEKDVADAMEFGPSFSPRSPGLMTIQELAEAFKEGDFSGRDVTLYAYIAENYYENESLASFVNYDPVNGESKSRKMMIAITRSQSGSSSVSTSKYVIQQKPITSIYNLANSSVAGAQTFGIEWVNENLPASYDNKTYEGKAKSGLAYGLSKDDRGKDKWNGLANMKAELKKGGVYTWKDSDISLSQLDYAKAYAACMSRNRDENGDGQITENEIKWYLPAVNQYQYLWTGTDALPDEARLYPRDFRMNNVWEFYHFATSGGNLYWAEEGNATSMNLDEYGYLGYEKYHVRCARNLGKGTSIQIAEKTDNTKDNFIVLDLKDRLTAISLRQSPVQGELLKHNEYSENNKLYKKIRVAKNLIKAGGSNFDQGKNWSETAALIHSNNDPCKKKFGEGWRAPNQREMILITTAGGLTGDKVDIYCSTYFSFWDYETNKAKSKNPAKEERMGFTYCDGDYMTLGATNNKHSIRCVQDVE